MVTSSRPFRFLRPGGLTSGEVPRAFGPLDGLYRRLVEYLPEAVYCCDISGRIILYNEAAVQLWGRTPQLDTDRWGGAYRTHTPAGELLPPGHCPMALTILSGRNAGSAEVVIERPDGSKRFVLAHPQLIKNDVGDMLGGVNVIIDITDRKQAENLLHEADRRKNEFLSMLAHELRNPLAPVHAAADILKRAELPDANQRLAIQMIDRQITQLARLVDDLLDVARMQRGMVSLKKTRVPLDVVLSNATDVIQPEITRRSQVLQVQAPAEAIVLCCDPVRLAQMIGNLLHNASKYTQDAGHITVSANVEQGNICIAVADDGMGMEPEVLDDVFDMFSRAGGVSGHVTDGLGIGLSVVRAMAELHGGTVSAYSKGVGHGSTFTLRLPVLSSPGELSPQPDRLAHLRQRSLRVFLVDDNVDSVTAQQILLESEGHIVHCAYDGFTALEAAPTFAADAYVIDIGLPGMNGYELVRTLRTLPEAADATIIAMSGWGSPEDVQRAIEAGFDRHLSKPVAFAELLSCLLADYHH